MKHYLLMATAILAMASCANDTDLSGSAPSALGDGSIAFNMNTPAATRAGSETDAEKLGGMFIVWGEKNENGSGKAAEAANTVFQNYVVKYTANTANTTTSNTANWEYVGIDHSDFDTYVKNTIGAGKSQTIKYWDDQATDYTFTAISALQTDIAAGNVVITKNTTSSTATDGDDADNGSVYDKGYTVQVKAKASVDNIFYADRKPIAKGDNGYTNQAVEMTFRNFMSKVRFGIYETVPGYKVVITGIRYNTGTGDDKIVTNPTTTTNGDNNSTTNNTFGIDGDFVTTGDNTKFKVTYENDKSAHKNRAKVELDGDTYNTNTYLNTGGTTWLTTTDGIGTASNNPTWDNVSENTVNWKTILPNPSNKTNLKLQIAYKLVSEDTGEEIVFKNNGTEIFRTVEVPAEYCQWKSNYAYSYIFKISDKSAELYPITFDAVVESEQTGNQETITTVTDPSITTIASRTGDDGNTTIVNGENEYKSGDVVYATVMDGSSLATLSTGNIKLYTVTTTDATNYPITEASVAHALSQATGTSTNVTATEVNITETNNLSMTAPTEDGKTVKLDENNYKALKWTAENDKVYAVRYTKTVDSKDTYTYKIVRINGATGGSTGGQTDDSNIEPVSLNGLGSFE